MKSVMKILIKILMKIADGYAWYVQKIAFPLADKLFRDKRREYPPEASFKPHSLRSITKVQVYPSGNSRRIVNARPNSLPYHLEKGWRKSGRTYQGYYRCRLGAFRGEIEERPDGYRFYILDPPLQVTQGSHGPCFTYGGSMGRYHIHFAINSQNLDSGIMAVERILFESLKNNRR